MKLLEKKNFEDTFFEMRKLGGKFHIGTGSKHWYFPEKENLRKFMEYLTDFDVIFLNGGNKVTDPKHEIYDSEWSAKDFIGWYHLRATNAPNKDTIKIEFKGAMSVPIEVYKNMEIYEEEPDRVRIWTDVHGDEVQQFKKDNQIPSENSYASWSEEEWNKFIKSQGGDIDESQKKFKGYKEFRDWLKDKKPQLGQRMALRVGEQVFHSPMDVLQYFDKEQFESVREFFLDRL